MTAPLCGKVSMPPLAIDGDAMQDLQRDFAASAAAMNVSDIAASAMLMPPEADPVMPASIVTVIASLTSGLGMALSASVISEESRQRRDDGAENRIRTRYSSRRAARRRSRPCCRPRTCAITGRQANASTAGFRAAAPPHRPDRGDGRELRDDAVGETGQVISATARRREMDV